MTSRMCRTLILVSIALCTLVAGGCGYNYKGSIDKVVKPYRDGRFAEAAMSAEAGHQGAPDHDHLIWLLERGATQLADENNAASNVAFEQADTIFQRLEKNPETNLGRESIAVLANPAALEYQGFGYERIMLNVYKAINYLDAGDTANARVEIRRVAEAQVAYEIRRKAQLAEAERLAERGNVEAARESRSVRANVKPHEVANSAEFAQVRQSMLADFPELGSAPITPQQFKAVYTNPYAEYLQGIFLQYSTVPGQSEVGRVALRNTLAMSPRNRYVARDLQAIEDWINGRGTPRVYVVFETGMAPRRREVRIDLPIGIFNLKRGRDLKIDYIGVAFPVLDRIGGQMRYITVTAEGRARKSQLLADIDQIVAREFQVEIQTIVTRLIVGTAIKLATQYAVAESLKDADELIQRLARFAVAAIQAGLNEADTRSWRTLPKQVQIVSLPTPRDGRLEIKSPRGSSLAKLTVTPNQPYLVWVRSTRDGRPTAVRLIDLNQR